MINNGQKFTNTKSGKTIVVLKVKPFGRVDMGIRPLIWQTGLSQIFDEPGKVFFLEILEGQPDL